MQVKWNCLSLDAETLLCETNTLTHAQMYYLNTCPCTHTERYETNQPTNERTSNKNEDRKFHSVEARGQYPCCMAMPSIDCVEDRCWPKRDGVPQECALTHTHTRMPSYPFSFYSLRSDLLAIHVQCVAVYWCAIVYVCRYMFHPLRRWVNVCTLYACSLACLYNLMLFLLLFFNTHTHTLAHSESLCRYRCAISQRKAENDRHTSYRCSCVYTARKNVDVDIRMYACITIERNKSMQTNATYELIVAACTHVLVLDHS